MASTNRTRQKMAKALQKTLGFGLILGKTNVYLYIVTSFLVKPSLHIL